MKRIVDILNCSQQFRYLYLYTFFCVFICCPISASGLENPGFFPAVYELLLAEKEPYLAMTQPVIDPGASINVNFGNLPGNNGDWVGIFSPEAESNWDNVIRWSYTNATTSMELTGPVAGSLMFAALPDASYEARLFFNNNYVVKDSVIFRVGEIIGPREVASTPLAQGTLFASTDGTGQECSLSTPCAVQTAFGRLNAGDVLFLRGGTYLWSGRVDVKASGTANQPIIIESFPGEHAILDGNRLTPQEIKDNPIPGIWVYSGNDYIHVRKLEVKNMGGAGIKLESSYNLIEGCKIHGNHYNGIHIVDGNWNFTDDLGKGHPFTTGNNTITDNIIYDNSDVGLLWEPGLPFNDGGNSDGVSISHSKNNIIVHNMVFSNSDDGIDTYCSNNAYVSYNISHSNGLGTNGNGNGFKTGCDQERGVIGVGAVVERNVSYGNRMRDFDYNGGIGEFFNYNTAYITRGEVGFKTGTDTTVEYNISTSPDHESNTDIHEGHHNNSWQMQGAVEFISTNPASREYLQPMYGSAFDGIGVYGH